jgi:hypothetical protein
MTGKKKRGYRDTKAPVSLQLFVYDSSGKELGRAYAVPKDFSTGSVGFYATGKIINPDNPEARYQIGFTATLIGSKPAS